MRRIAQIVGLGLFLAACATQPATQPTAQPSPALPASSLPERPTATLADYSAEPTINTGSVIFAVPADGSIRAISLAGQHYQLANETQPNAYLPWSASPDGKQLAIVVFNDNHPKIEQIDLAELWVVDVDEQNPRRLLNLLPATASDQAPALGRKSALIDQAPVWSHDGKTIILASAHEQQVDLYAVDVATGTAQRLTNTPDLEVNLELSADGSHLAFASASSFGTGGGAGNPMVQIYRFADASFTPITADPLAMGSRVVGWLDHQLITQFNSQPDGRASFIVFDANTGAITPLAQAMAFEAEIKANSLIYVNQPRDGIPTIYRWDGSGEVALLENLHGSAVSLSPSSQAMLLCNDNQPSYVRNGLLSALSANSCEPSVWATDDWLAINGTEQSNGLIINPEGQSQILPQQAVMAGWNEQVLYFFAPQANGWQLFKAQRGSSQLQPIGQALSSQPHNPRLILAP
ncbi:hypothetical protein [Herpetosiphon gulosus]|uniref:Tol-Pal system protein TolB n=1 Tax=Herpetosiphon gulosus TaxID=1973496 RepID=A0ABP9WXB2_9CHLR